MASRDDFDDFFGDDDEPPIADTRADGRLYRVPLARLAPNLVNPRTDFGTEDQLIDFGKSLARRQNQPCPVVSRVAYLKLWPDHASKIGDTDYVLVSGERRYRAATAVGLPGLDCVANDDFARDRRTFMEAVVSENVDRQNFDPVEEAYAVQALATEFGSNRAVAQHFERADGWVTQRILLTHLAREVQDMVRSKEIPLEAARSLGKLARDNNWSVPEQLAWWEDKQERRTAAAAARTAARKAPKQQPDIPPTPAPKVLPAATPTPTEPVREQPSFTAVKQDPVELAKRESGPADYHGVIVPQTPASDSPPGQAPPPSQPAAAAAPGQAGTAQHPVPAVPPQTISSPPNGPRVLEYDKPGVVAMHLDAKMRDDDLYFELVRNVNTRALQRDPERLRELFRELTEQLST